MYYTPLQFPSDCRITGIDLHLQVWQQTVWILISWLLLKPADLGPYCLRKRIYPDLAWLVDEQTIFLRTSWGHVKIYLVKICEFFALLN